MREILLVSIALSLVSQAIGLLAYYSKRNKYSKSTQILGVFTPAFLFIALTLICSVFVLLIKDDRGEMESWLNKGELPNLTILYFGGYLLAGFFLNAFFAILTQLTILLLFPPKYKAGRKRRRESHSKLAL